jgi:large subunit ribosomal protein L22
MTSHKYAFQANENMAKAVGRDLVISTKTALEVCRFIRGKPLERAKRDLNQVILGTLAVPYKRHNKDIPHRTKLGPGRYPRNVATAILGVLEGVTSNAQTKGLSTSKLGIVHICAHKASSPMRGGRQRGREGKRTHIEVVVQEVKLKEKKVAKKVNKEKSVEKKVEAPKEVDKIENKPDVVKTKAVETPVKVKEDVKEESKE